MSASHFPPLTLGWREATHGRRFADVTADIEPFCTECLNDLPVDRGEQAWHLCPVDATPERVALVALVRRLTVADPEVVRPDGVDEQGRMRVYSSSVRAWMFKRDAVAAARAIGFPQASVVRAAARFRLVWVIIEQHEETGPLVLTPHGYDRHAARRATEHRTRTFEYGHETVSYRVNSRGMRGYRVDFHTCWVCSCGHGGHGRDRDRASAQQAAKLHREDPSGFPGQPWPNHATVAAVRAGSY